MALKNSWYETLLFWALFATIIAGAGSVVVIQAQNREKIRASSQKETSCQATCDTHRTDLYPVDKASCVINCLDKTEKGQ